MVNFLTIGSLSEDGERLALGWAATWEERMLFKIFTAKRAEAVEDEATGTFADGAFHFPATDVASLRRKEGERSAHERDYGANRTVSEVPPGFA